MAERARWHLEVGVAAVVVAVVAMMVVPLPRPLLDVLLTVNLAAAVALLMAAVFAPRPLQFAAFPTLLVVTTLFRIGLNVSTTRLILADADAGAVVRAFGASVAAQSLVVGLVVFAVITVVQLVVVARGAERVAEVAARFALDAMPGKQMAIDAELRAGTLDRDAARARREDLDRQSQLYGAMDGAMRFVKGDAVAAIIIVGINLVGGLVIGLGYRKMSAADAVSTYSILSIGEGLVSQIPSLLVAVASGLLVTRVAASGDRALSEDLSPELFADPRALAGVAALLGGLAVLPQMPTAPFLALAALSGAGALWARRWRRARRAHDASGAPTEGPSSALVVRLGGEPPRRRDELDAALGAAREAFVASTGLPLPALSWRVDRALPPRALELDVHGTPVLRLTLEGDAAPSVRHQLPTALAELAPELVELDLVQRLVTQAQRLQPVLAREVVPSMIGLAALTEVVRGLVRERVPLGDFGPVLAALAGVAQPSSKEPTELVELVRARMQRQICWRWAPRGELAVFTLDGMIEDALRTSIDRRDGQAVLALEPEIADDIIRAVREATASAQDGVILTSGDVRRHLRGLLAAELPRVAVLAPHELPAGTSVKATARISV
ncbi:MAG: flagellar biosynthesis protein FlhA [Kofleriaceae bacterium]